MVFQKNHLAECMLKGEYALYAHVISIYIYISAIISPLFVVIYIYAPLYPLWSGRHMYIIIIHTHICIIVPSWYSIESHRIIFPSYMPFYFSLYIYILMELSSIWNSVVSDVHHSPVIFFHLIFRLQSFRQRCRQLRSVNGDVHGEMVDVSIEVNGFHYGS